MCARRARPHESSLTAARYAHKTFSKQIQTAYQRTAPVPLQKRRT